MNKLLLLVIFLYTASLTAATITSNQTGHWNAISTWVGGVIPTATDDVVIASNPHRHTVRCTGLHRPHRGRYFDDNLHG